MSGLTEDKLSSEAVFTLSFQRSLICSDLKSVPLLFLPTIFDQNSCFVSVKSIFKVAANGQGWKTKYFPKTLMLHALHTQLEFFFSFEKNIEAYRLNASLITFLHLRSSRLLKLHQCEIESCIYV